LYEPNWSSAAYALRSHKWSFMRHQNLIMFPYWPTQTSSKRLGYWSTLSPAIHNDHTSIRLRDMKCSFYQQLVALEICSLNNIFASTIALLALSTSLLVTAWEGPLTDFRIKQYGQPNYQGSTSYGPIEGWGKCTSIFDTWQFGSYEVFRYAS